MLGMTVSFDCVEHCKRAACMDSFYSQCGCPLPANHSVHYCPEAAVLDQMFFVWSSGRFPAILWVKGSRLWTRPSIGVIQWV